MTKRARGYLGIVLTILLLSVVSAHLGMRPAVINLDYESGKEVVIDYYVDTTPDIRTNISAEGDMSENVKFDKTKIQGSGNFKATITMPKEAKKVGQNLLYIFAKQEVDPKAGFGTAISVGALIKIHVPYPGRYLESTLAAEDVNKGEPIVATISVTNRGIEKLTINPIIQMYSGEELIETKQASEKGEIILEPTTTEDISTQIKTTDYLPGNYKIVSTIDYGGEKPSINEKAVRIGELNIQIKNYTKEIFSGKINPFVITIQNDWKDRIEGVYANITLTGVEGGISFLTPPVTVSGFQDYELKGFADATNTKKGAYEANITINYAGKTSSIRGEVEVATKNNLLIMIVLLVIIIAILALVIIIYKNKKSNSLKATSKK